MVEFKMAEFKMATIIKLSQNEWVKFFYVQIVGTKLGVVREFEKKYYDGWTKMTKFKMAEFKMDAIIKLSENEWVWIRLN